MQIYSSLNIVHTFNTPVGDVDVALSSEYYNCFSSPQFKQHRKDLCLKIKNIFARSAEFWSEEGFDDMVMSGYFTDDVTDELKRSRIGGMYVVIPPLVSTEHPSIIKEYVYCIMALRVYATVLEHSDRDTANAWLKEHIGEFEDFYILPVIGHFAAVSHGLISEQYKDIEELQTWYVGMVKSVIRTLGYGSVQ